MEWIQDAIGKVADQNAQRTFYSMVNLGSDQELLGSNKKRMIFVVVAAVGAIAAAVAAVVE